MKKYIGKLLLIILILATISVIATLDFLSQNIAVSFLYFLVVLYTWLYEENWPTYAVTALCIVLILVDLIIQEDAENTALNFNILNGFLSILVNCLAAFLVLMSKRSYRHLKEVSKNLSTEVEKRTRQAQESEERLRHMVNEVQDYAIYRLDSNGRIAMWNKGAEKIKGYKKEEVLGEHISIFYDLEQLNENLPQNLLQAAKDKGRVVNEGWRYGKNRKKIWVHITITALYDKQQNLNGYIKIVRDRTETKHLEDQIKSSELLYRSILESAQDSIFTFNDKGIIETMNEAMAKQLNQTQGQIIGSNICHYLSAEFKNLPENELAQALKGKEIVKIHRPDGSHFPAEIRISELNLEKGTTYSAILRDLTHQLQTERLKLAQHETDAKNKELEQFIYVASHDLTEPLRNVESIGSLLQNQEDFKNLKDSKTYLNVIFDSTKRLKDLIRDLLDYSMIGRTEANQIINCNQIVDELVTDLNGELSKRNIFIDYPILPDVLGDELELKQLFSHLINNAITYRKKDSSLHINIACEKTSKNYIFSISDNGIGISKAFFAKIFQPFQRLHNRASYQGTGIGLAICKKIVEGHGGKIWVNSEPNEGSTFYFSLFPPN